MKIMHSLVVLLMLTGGVQAQNASGVDPNVLEKIRHEAEAANSDAVIIMQNGSLIAEWYFGKEKQKIETMSALKSIVSLAIGRLISTGQIDSVNQPVYTFYPQWKQGKKKTITIKHLLNHTSGLQNVSNAGAEIYPSPNALELALAAELSDDPGTKFAYNNKAVNLLAGIIEKASGMRMDRYFEKEFFEILDIGEHKWYYDKSGQPHAMAGLELHAIDFAKFGQIVLNKGAWQEKQLIEKSYIKEMLEQSQPYYPFCGYLWWRIPSYINYYLNENDFALIKKSGLSAKAKNFLQNYVKAEPYTREKQAEIVDQLYKLDSKEKIMAAMKLSGRESVFRLEYGDIVGYYADGYLGQYIMFVPEFNIVAVRQVKNRETFDFRKDTFNSFQELVLSLGKK